MSFLDFLLSISITVLFYLFTPVLLTLSKKKYKESTLKVIAIVNGIICFFLFSFFHYSVGDGNTANIAAAFIWSSLGYYILKKNCLQFEQDSSSIEEIKPSDAKKSMSTNILIWLNVLLSILVIFMFYNYYELTFEVSAQYDHILELESNYDELRENLYYVTDLHIPEMQKYLDKIDEVIGVEPSNPYADTHLEWRLKRLEDALNIWP